MICLNEGVEPKEMTLEDLYIDIGAHDEEEARAMVGIGDTAVYDTPTFGAGDRLVSPYMDNRISCIVLLMAMEQFQKSENDLYFVFTVQEELGLRGAKTAAYAIDPDYGIAVDVTVSADELGSKHSGSSRLGGGAAIKVMDSSIICHPEMVSKLSALAGERAYVEMFTGSSELMSHVERMAGNAGCEVQQRRRFVLRDESAFEDFAAAQGADMPELSDTAQAELKIRLALLMPSLDVLAARPAGTEGIYLQVLWVDVDLHLISFRQDGHRDGGGLYLALAIGDGHPLHSVDAAFKL